MQIEEQVESVSAGQWQGRNKEKEMGYNRDPGTRPEPDIDKSSWKSCGQSLSVNYSLAKFHCICNCEGTCENRS